MRLSTASVAVMACLTTFVFADTANGQPRSYQIVDLGPGGPGGCVFAAPQINQSGQAIISSGPYYYDSAYLVDAGGTHIDLGSLAGHGAVGTGINAAGQVIGYSAMDLNGNTHPFFWSQQTGMVDLTPAAQNPDLPIACNINNNGDVVGGLWVDTSSSRQFHGFLYTAGLRYDMNSLPIAGLSHWDYLGTGVGINDSGTIVGVGVIQGVGHGYMLVPVGGNLLTEGGFEGYAPPALGSPGWLSDTIRQIPAKSETNQPNTGSKNGACWATTNQDCGMYQEVKAPATGSYRLTFYANADRPGGLIGANIVNANNATAASSHVAVRSFGYYGTAYVMTFPANAGDTIRVWMYSPATPGYVVIDDVSLILEPAGP
jgi:probable HAF family extracellular repeat protein